MDNLGDWIRDKHGSQAGLAEKLGVQQSRISKWLKGREPIPEAYQAKLRAMKYAGPWPREEAQEAPAGDFTPREDYWKLVGRVEALERIVQNLSEGYQAHILKEPGKAHPQESKQ